MTMTANDTDLTTIPGWKTHMDTAQRILELEQQLKEAQAENARLRAGFDDLETVVNHLTPGWYVLTPGNYEACRTRTDALRLAAEYEGENVALVIRVEERFGAEETVVTPEDMDAYDGVRRGVDYPATHSHGVAARVA
ncbi:MAG: hypothetical protein HDR50_06675 [Desulfovibrio sp.]|uniref:hypothetical protein n=1 Tax=Desulfovibrio sp. TaxID=885 RepID=UPI001A67B1CE|nr:hypothetical protein [Desulfovibrio sp.]MBD5417332.1 hypothetical protein [Desulfovibrio sp.]